MCYVSICVSLHDISHVYIYILGKTALLKVKEVKEI